MDARDKVAAIFTELVGAHANRLSASHYPADVNSRITKALTKDDASDSEILKKDEAAFHIVDWQADAAFVVALSLYPEKFTDEEIEDGVMSLLQHAPRHLVKAARILDYPISEE